MITQLAELLPKLQQDPTPIINLVEKLIRPSTFTFGRVLEIKPEIDFVAGLSAPIPSINLITLSLLGKATLAKSDSDILAGRPNVVAALVRLWLCTIDTEVAGQSRRTLEGLLMAGRDGASTQAPIDENLMWRRLFRDRDIYGSIFALCSFQTLGLEGQLNRSRKTIAQGRLLNLLLSIDSEPVRRSQFPDIESTYGITDDGGLLSFATMHMIDFKNDILMHLAFIEFCTGFVISLSPLSDSSKAIDFLTKAGVHSRIVSYYTDAGRIEIQDAALLFRASAMYVAAYASHCPSHLLGDSSVLESILTRLSRTFNSSVDFTSPDPDKFGSADYSVLMALPKAALRTEPQLEAAAEHFDGIDETPERVFTQLATELVHDVVER